MSGTLTPPTLDLPGIRKWAVEAVVNSRKGTGNDAEIVTSSDAWYISGLADQIVLFVAADMTNAVNRMWAVESVIKSRQGTGNDAQVTDDGSVQMLISAAAMMTQYVTKGHQ